MKNVRTTLTSLVAAVTFAAGVGCATTRSSVQRSDGYARAADADAVPVAAQVVRGETIRPGTQLTVQLDQAIGTGVSRPGQRFTATVLSPLVDAAGRAIVPAGAQVSGHIVALQPGDPRGTTPALVSLAFDSVRVGEVVQPLFATVVEARVPTHHRVRASPVAGGGLGGAAVGVVIGRGLRGVALGGALGAGDGTLVSLGTSALEARLPAGTPLIIRTESALPVAALRRLPLQPAPAAYGGGPRNDPNPDWNRPSYETP